MITFLVLHLTPHLIHSLIVIVIRAFLRGLFPGTVPNVWVRAARHCCASCCQLVANSDLPLTPNASKVELSLLLIHWIKGTAAGPSGLRIQHLLDAALITLPTSICATLGDIGNILASGKAPPLVSRFLARGTLIALNKLKDGSPPDIRPKALGESLRRLTGKCSSLVKNKASDLFQPLQLGVACSSGSEKIVHGLRKNIEEHWMKEDFVVFKIDMRNAFHLVSRQAVLDECATFFPELLPWVTWCYGTYPLLWHQLGHLSSETGVQQGDPFGPLLFSLVFQRLISSIDHADGDCLQVLFQAWWVLTGSHSAVLRALSLIEELGPSLGSHINLAKFKFSHYPNLDILGVPIGVTCTVQSSLLESVLMPRNSCLNVAAIDPHVALSLLRLCGSYCRLVHLARATPSNLASSLKLFDDEVRKCFSSCFAIGTTNPAWIQAQLSLGFGGLGLRSLAHHSCAAFITSLSTSGCSSADNLHLKRAVNQFNDQVSPSDNHRRGIINTTLSKKLKLECHILNSFLGASSMADRARLLSVSAPRTASWLFVVPSPVLGLHLELNELQASIRWWLGLDTSGGSLCPVCSEKALDPLGHHAITCTHGGDVVTRHNLLWDVVANLFHRPTWESHLRLHLIIATHMHPADVMVARWERGLPAALDITMTFPLTPAILDESCLTAGIAAESLKHVANDPKCVELGWTCVPCSIGCRNMGIGPRDIFPASL
eukprot:Em0015g458a